MGEGGTHGRDKGVVGDLGWGVANPVGPASIGYGFDIEDEDEEKGG